MPQPPPPLPPPHPTPTLLPPQAAGTGEVEIFAWPEGTRLGGLRGHTSTVFALATHPGGTYLASGGADAGVCVWDLRMLACVASHGKIEKGGAGAGGAVRRPGRPQPPTPPRPRSPHPPHPAPSTRHAPPAAPLPRAGAVDYPVKSLSFGGAGGALLAYGGDCETVAVHAWDAPAVPPFLLAVRAKAGKGGGVGGAGGWARAGGRASRRAGPAAPARP